MPNVHGLENGGILRVHFWDKKTNKPYVNQILEFSMGEPVCASCFVSADIVKKKSVGVRGPGGGIDIKVVVSIF